MNNTFRDTMISHEYPANLNAAKPEAPQIEDSTPIRGSPAHDQHAAPRSRLTGSRLSHSPSVHRKARRQQGVNNRSGLP
jgi:hypothetical protein